MRHNINTFFESKKKNKYNAVATIVDGWRFDSKKEAAHYVSNKLLIEKGEMLCQLRQTPFHLPGKVVYRLDFMEFMADGTVLFVDVKGRDTAMSKLKRKLVEELYPVIITLV